MKLQILVPQWLETDDVVKPLLDSIEVQQNIDKNDIGVIIVNDGSDVHLSSEFLNKYSYHIDYYLHEHGDTSATRNACLDYATADYVMFCDADDMFYRIDGLNIIFDAMEKGFDLLNSNFLQERLDKNTGKLRLVTHRRDCTFVHGKVLRRKFLLDNNIRWNEKLTRHEDGYFNTLCVRLAKTVTVVDSPFYLWKWRAESITREKPYFIIRTYEYYVDVLDALVDEFLRRDRMFDAQDLTTAALLNFYFMSNSKDWQYHQSEEHRIISEKSIKEFYLKFKGIFKTFSIEQKNKILVRIQEKMRRRNVGTPSISFADWLIKLENS
jgi:glycosyltransferase involved in cell wall biosynthesis